MARLSARRPQPRAPFPLSHPYTTAGSYPVTVQIRDNYMPAGTFQTVSFTATVATPPALTAVSDQNVVHNTDLPLNFTFSAVCRTPTATRTTSTGATRAGRTTCRPARNVSTDGTGTGTFSGSHTYKHKGTYTVYVTVADAYGVNNTISFLVNVT